MAEQIQATVINIGGRKIVAQNWSFPTQEIIIAEVIGGGINASILWNETLYYVQETLSSLVTAANAGGGSSYLVYANVASFPATGTSGVLYFAQNVKTIYLWDGAVYVPCDLWVKNTDDQYYPFGYEPNVLIQPLGQNTGDGILDISTPNPVTGPLAQFRNASSPGNAIPGLRVEKFGGLTVGATSLTGVVLPIAAGIGDALYIAKKTGTTETTDINIILQTVDAGTGEYLTEQFIFDLGFYNKETKYKKADGTGFYFLTNIQDGGFAFTARKLVAGNPDAVLFQLEPTVADGSTPHILDTSIAHTSGNLIEVKNNAVEKFSVGFGGVPKIQGIQEFADNAAAVTGGLSAGQLYRTADVLKIVHA